MFASLLLAASLPVQIDFKPVATKVQAGEEVLFVAPTKNISRQNVLLVLQGDSMHGGRKAPIIQIMVRPAGSSEWKTPTAVGCGNTNPLEEGDFVTLAPGKTVDLLNGMRWSKYEVSLGFPTPGRYEAKLVVDTTPPLDRWIGGPMPPEMENQAISKFSAKYQEVPKFRFESKAVQIEVVNRP